MYVIYLNKQEKFRKISMHLDIGQGKCTYHKSTL